jgi:hypothetical protein
LTSEFGSTLQSDTITFEFLTPNPLPPNLSDVSNSVSPPASSVPVLDWSVSVGPYQANGSCLGVGFAGACNNSYFVLFNTNSIGAIDGWLFLVNPVTTDDENLIAVASGSPATLMTIFTTGVVADYVQVNPNAIGAEFTEFAVAVNAGSWTEVPEPNSGAILASGIVLLVGVTLLAGERRRRQVALNEPIKTSGFFRSCARIIAQSGNSAQGTLARELSFLSLTDREVIISHR